MPLHAFDGRQIAAARALANISAAELAKAAGVTPRTIGRLEVDVPIAIAPRRRHGCVSQATIDKIVDALSAYGVALLPETETAGSGVRWLQPRSRRG